MKNLLVIIIFGALMYFVFFQGDTKKVEEVQKNNINENTELREELGVETKSYDGAITEGYNKVKNLVDSAKDSVSKIEERNAQ